MNLRDISLAVGLGLLWGCGDSHGHEDHDHPHGEGHDHDHPHGHEGHVHKAHYGGMLVPLGEEFANVEVLLDGESGKLNAWVWDGCAEKPIRLSQAELVIDIGSGEEARSVNLGAVADKLTGETVGDSCQFEGQDDALKGLERFSGTLRKIEVKGQPLENVAFDYEPGD